MASNTLRNRIKKFSEKHVSKDKIFINAVVMSDSTFVTTRKTKGLSFKFIMYLYSAIIFLVTALSLAMLSIPQSTQIQYKGIISAVEAAVFVVLVIDVILRWYTSEVRSKYGNFAYFLFPITFTGVMLILSLMPSLYLINIWTGQNIKAFNILENMKFLRIFRIILLAPIIPGMSLFTRVLTKEKSTLITVFGLVAVSILLFSLVIFNVERGIDANGLKDGMTGFDPKTVGVNNFLDAVYGATIALTTIGFGDVTPHTQMGKVIFIIMAIMGVAILAIPSGIIAGGFINELKLNKIAKEKIKAKKKSSKKK